MKIFAEWNLSRFCNWKKFLFFSGIACTTRPATGWEKLSTHGPRMPHPPFFQVRHHLDTGSRLILSKLILSITYVIDAIGCRLTSAMFPKEWFSRPLWSASMIKIVCRRKILSENHVQFNQKTIFLKKFFYPNVPQCILSSFCGQWNNDSVFTVRH